MRSLLAACVALGAVAVAAVPAAQAELVIGVPGVHVDVGPHPHYWHHGYYEHRRWEERRGWCYYHGCR
jgi:hypothetical protein